MSLKEVGKLKSLIELINSPGGGTKKTTESIVSLINGLTKSEALDKLTKLGMSAEVANNFTEMAKCIDDVSDSVNVANKSTGTLSDAFTGAGSKIKSFFTTSALGVTALVAGITAAIVALDDFMTLDYREAFDQYNISRDNKQTAKTNLESTKSELESINQRITEINSNPLTFTSRVELENLQKQKAELESMQKIQENMLEASTYKAAMDAFTASNAKTGDFAAATESGNWFQNLYAKFLSTDNSIVKGIRGLAGLSPMSNSISTFKEDDIALTTIARIKELQQDEKELKSQLKYDGMSDNYYSDKNNQLLELQSTMANLQSDLSSRQTSISGLIDDMTDDNGKAIDKRFQGRIDTLKDTLNEIQHFDTSGMSDIEKQFNSIDKFFGSSNSSFIKDNLLNAAKSGKDLEQALNSLGLEFSDLGENVDKNSLEQYFDELVGSAEDASKAIKEVDGSFEGVSAAFESANAGDQWKTQADRLKQAHELYTKGEIGTDDFQSMAQWISKDNIAKELEKGLESGNYTYAADAYKDAWEKSYNTVKRWFDNENPVQSMWNFANDLEAKESEVGKNLIDINKQSGEIVPKFENTAEAAKALGVNVDVVESVLNRMKDYGFEFDDVMFSGDGLSRYEKSLSGIKSIYDSMSEGSEKKKLGKLIENWDDEFAGYENDLSTLTEPQIVEIEFQYDLASIRSEIAELDAAWEEGDRSAKTGASRNAAKKKYRDKMEGETGFDESDSVGYKKASDTITKLQGEFENAKTEEAREDIQETISSVYDLQNAFQDAFNEDNSVNWDDFLKSDEAGDIFNNLDSDAKKLLDIPTHLEMDVGIGLTSDKVEEEMEKLASGSTIKFTADIDGIQREITALKEEDGTITYTANIDGESVKVLVHQDGTVTYYKDGQEEASDSKAGVDYSKTRQEEASDSNAGVGYYKTGQDAPSDKTAGLWYKIKGVIGSVKNFLTGGSGLTGTAHISGTPYTKKEVTRKTGGLYPIPKLSGRALAMGTLEDGSWLRDSWKTKKDEVALTGEVGQELVVDAKTNRWWTVGDNGAEFSSIPKNSVVFDARKTRELLERGYTNSRGKIKGNIGDAKLSGTAYATGGRLPVGGGYSSGGGGSSSKASSAGRSAANAAKSFAQAASSASEAAKEFKEAFDHIEILVDRMERSFDNLVDSIGKYSNDLSKQSSLADQAINSAKSNIATLQQAYNRYIQEANSVGLEQNWKNVVHNGEIQISQITDEDLKNRIDDYQKWYEKALDMQDKILDLEGEILDLAIEKLDNIDTYFSNRFDYNDQFGYANNVDKITEALNRYTNELNTQVNNGIIKEFSKEWYDAQKKIADYSDSLFEATLRKYDDIIDYLGRISDNFDGYSKVSEAKGEKLTQQDYLEQIDVQNKLIDESFEKIKKLREQQAIWDVGSDKYNDIADQIQDVTDDIYDAQESIQDFKKAIWEIRWDPFFKGQEAASDLISETDELRDLIKDDALVAKNGSLTSDGLAYLGLTSSAMNTAKQQIRDYQEAIKKLAEDLENGNITTEDYEEHQKDFLESIRDSVGVVEDYKNEIIDLWETQLKAENDVIQDSIDKRKELLRTQKEYDSYAKNVRNQTKDINAIKSQMAALQGVNNESAKAELKRLQAQLADAEESLQETRKDHEYEVREKGLDTTSDNLNKALEDTLDAVLYNASEQEKVISNMLNNVVNNYHDAYGKIQGIINSTGFTPSTGLGNNLNNLNSQTGAQNQVNASNTNAPNYTPNTSISGMETGQIVDSSTENKNDSIIEDVSKVPDISNRPVAQITLKPSSVSIEEGKSATVVANVRPTDAANKELTWTSSNTSVATVSKGTIKAVKPGSAKITVAATDGSGIFVECSVTVTKKPDPPKPAPKPSSPQGNGVPQVGDRVRFNSGVYYNDSYGRNPWGNWHRGEEVYITYMNPGAPYPIHIGTRSTPGYNSDLGWLRQDQVSGYAKGTRNATQGVHLTDEKGLGSEVILTKYGALRQLNAGDKVFNDKQASALWNLSKTLISGEMNLGNQILPTLYNNVEMNNGNVNIHIDNMVGCVESITRDSLPEFEEIMKRSCDYTVKMLTKEYGLRWGKK